MIMREVIVTEPDGTKRIFPSVAKTGEYYGTTATAITNRILGKVKGDPRKIEYTGKTFVGAHNKKKGCKDDDDDTPVNIKREEVQYETIGTRVCITPCKYRANIKVGSSRCQGCSRFHGINRDKHVVICG